MRDCQEQAAVNSETEKLVIHASLINHLQGN